MAFRFRPCEVEECRQGRRPLRSMCTGQDAAGGVRRGMRGRRTAGGGAEALPPSWPGRHQRPPAHGMGRPPCLDVVQLIHYALARASMPPQ